MQARLLLHLLYPGRPLSRFLHYYFIFPESSGRGRSAPAGRVCPAGGGIYSRGAAGWSPLFDSPSYGQKATERFPTVIPVYSGLFQPVSVSPPARWIFRLSPREPDRWRVKPFVFPPFPFQSLAATQAPLGRRYDSVARLLPIPLCRREGTPTSSAGRRAYGCLDCT